MSRLAGKTAIVTGAGMRDEGVGTGRATAVLFAQEGAQVLLVDRDVQAAERTLAAIEADGGTASVFAADVACEADCRLLVEAAVNRYGGLDVLMNNVGVSGRGKVTEIDAEAWNQVMDVNVKSMALICKYAVPVMAGSGGGSIINVSSIDGIRAGAFHNVPYAVAKGGVIALSRAMAVHHGREGIRVNAIAPGHLNTPMVSALDDETLALRQQAGPLGTEGTGWDVAWAAVFLASEESRWITGVVLPVDAGTLAATPLSMLRHIKD
jgi:NAD(P)-dependent dehydrogenase (short-subunit alcohol dehydrogenase family)